jgi:ATP-binding cassette subfamily B protein
VARGLRQALPNATIIVITHKPALAQMADVVITLEDGRATMRRAREAACG